MDISRAILQAQTPAEGPEGGGPSQRTVKFKKNVTLPIFSTFPQSQDELDEASEERGLLEGTEAKLRGLLFGLPVVELEDGVLAVADRETVEEL